MCAVYQRVVLSFERVNACTLRSLKASAQGSYRGSERSVVCGSNYTAPFISLSAMHRRHSCVHLSIRATYLEHGSHCGALLERDSTGGSSRACEMAGVDPIESTRIASDVYLCSRYRKLLPIKTTRCSREVGSVLARRTLRYMACRHRVYARA